MNRTVSCRLLLLVAIAVFVMPGCRRSEGPEAEIRHVIAEMVQAAEAPDLGDLLRHVSEDYSDSDSNDKASLRGMLFAQLRRSGSVRVTYRVDTVDVRSESDAAVVLFAGIADGPIAAGDTRSDVLRFDIRFIVEDRDWVVRQVDWTRASVGDLLL